MTIPPMLRVMNPHFDRSVMLGILDARLDLVFVASQHVVADKSRFGVAGNALCKQFKQVRALCRCWRLSALA